MAYEPPVHVYIDETENNVVDNYVMERIFSVGVDIDRDELIKLISGDRDSYNNGYREGFNDAKKQESKTEMHVVTLEGCYGYTSFEMEMTDAEFEFIKRVSDITNKTSTCSCMPRLFIDHEDYKEIH